MNLKTRVFLVFLLLMTQVQAAGDAVDHIFTAGEVIKAEEVNANFQQLADRIDAVAVATNTATTFSYTDFTADTAITTRKYTVDVHQNMGSHDTEIHTISRSGTTLTVERKRLSDGESGTTTQCHKMTFDASNDQLALTKREHLDDTCSTAEGTFDLSPSIPILEASMAKGTTFGSGFEAEITAPGISTDTAYGNDYSIVLGTEDVTLTVNGTETTYSACLKVNRKRQFFSWGGDYQRTVWYCDGIGMTKMIETRTHVSGGSIIVGSRKRELYATN